MRLGGGADGEAMAEIAVRAKMREAVQGESLRQDAWRRLKKNKIAMGGLIVTILMSFSAAFAGQISPFNPATQQRWTGALSPGTTILSLRNEMRVAVGVRPLELEVPEACADVLGDGREHALTFDVEERTVAPLRIIVSGTLIERMQISVPGQVTARPDSVQIGEHEYFRDAATGDRLAVSRLTKGESLPAALVRADESGRYVVQVERVGTDPDGGYGIAVAFDGDGKATSITRTGSDGVAGQLPAATIMPRDVSDVRLDGERLTHTHLLGTDQQGRDTLSRMIFGGRISLLVGLAATMVSLFIGVIYGAVSGYAGGRTDNVMMRIVDILFGVPYLFVVILMMVAFGREIFVLFLALGALQWLTMARIVRGQVLSLREKEFVDAAITVGTRWTGILARHLIPNVLGIVVVYMTLTVPAVILMESFLAFVGLAVEWQGLPLESWGALINSGREALGNNGEFWWMMVFPSIAMSVTLFSLNFLGDGLRDALDPQQRGRT